MGMTLHEAIEVLKMYQYGAVDEMAPHSFDLNDETVKTILAALEKPQKCEDCSHGAHWGGVVICDRDGQRHERNETCKEG